MAESRLFTPMKIGNMEVKHRIGMAPLTRLRGTDGHVPVPLMKEYYSQRAAVPGTLIIAEGTFISAAACGKFPNAPGIWDEEQVEAWKPIVNEVHRKGCFLWCQLFGMGRGADPEVAEKEDVTIVGPSPIPIDPGSPVPKEMTIREIKQTVQDFVVAAENAIRAGFDGVEVHCANGYLLDQFLQDVSNQRTDEYGGSIENRNRIAVEILKATVDRLGPERVGTRISPCSEFQGMRMRDPVPQFTDLTRRANELKLAYIHVIESRVSGDENTGHTERIDFAYENFDGPLLVAGGYTLEDARRVVDEEHPDRDVMIIFGRQFVSNPDLVYRARQGIALSAYERDTFYTQDAEGYVDYPYSPEYLATLKA